MDRYYLLGAIETRKRNLNCTCGVLPSKDLKPLLKCVITSRERLLLPPLNYNRRESQGDR